MKILIAEDDATSRWLLERVLRRWGHETQSVESGGEALEVLQQPDSPQLAILDWLMPQMTGLEVCREIRRCSTLSTKYLILLTAKGEKEDDVRLHAGWTNDRRGSHCLPSRSSRPLCSILRIPTGFRNGNTKQAKDAKGEESTVCQKIFLIKLTSIPRKGQGFQGGKHWEFS